MSYAGGPGFNGGGAGGYSPSAPGAGGYTPSSPGAGGYSPSSPGAGGYAPSAPGAGYAGSNPGGFAPNQYNTYNQGQGQQGRESCTQAPGKWMLRNNPWKLANNVGPDILYAARYKQAMGLGLASILLSLFGFIFRGTETGGYVNAASFLHIIPILLPCCKRGASPFWWSLISLLSIVLAIVGFFLNLIDVFQAAAAIVAALVVLIELILLWILQKLDRELRSKVKECFAECGVCGEKKQLETMINQESAFNRPNMTPQMNRFNAAASQASSPPPGLGGDNGSLISGPGTGFGQNVGAQSYTGQQQNNFGGHSNWARNKNRTIRNALSDTNSEPSYTTSPSGVSQNNYNPQRNFRSSNSHQEPKRALQKTAPRNRRSGRPVKNYPTGKGSTFSFLTDVFKTPEVNTAIQAGMHYMAPTGAASPQGNQSTVRSGNGGPNATQMQARERRRKSRKYQSDVEFKGVTDQPHNDSSSQLSGASGKGSLVFETNAFKQYEDTEARPPSFTV